MLGYAHRGQPTMILHSIKIWIICNNCYFMRTLFVELVSSAKFISVMFFFTYRKCFNHFRRDGATRWHCRSATMCWAWARVSASRHFPMSLQDPFLQHDRTFASLAPSCHPASICMDLTALLQSNGGGVYSVDARFERSGSSFP